jgi:hypothetical protein
MNATLDKEAGPSDVWNQSYSKKKYTQELLYVGWSRGMWGYSGASLT